MRRTILSISFVALLVALWGLWQCRYERTQGFPVWRLTDIRENAPPVPGVGWLGTEDHPIVRVTVDSRNPVVAACFQIPGAPAVKMLHLKFRLIAYDLSRGKEKWEDGRFMVDWHDPSGMENFKTDPVGSIVGNDRSKLENIVIETRGDAAVPSLRLENLGSAGAFDLSDLEISVVNERMLWKTGKWLLAIAWLAWGFYVIRSWPGISRWRALAGSAIWLLACMNFVVPGPWKAQRPMGEKFNIGMEAPAVTIGKTPPPVGMNVGAVTAEGKMPVQGSFALQVKLLFAQARPFLHALLLFAPTLAMMYFIGKKPALWLSIILAFAIESAQAVFGYGFDWIDILDLTCDAVGVWLAVWSHAKMVGIGWIHPKTPPLIQR
ncbi:MAG: hypothetical protein WCS43_14170 [Verrucomicrobiota bacterium]